jgi:hypothetical protein
MLPKFRLLADAMDIPRHSGGANRFADYQSAGANKNEN